MGVRRIVRQPVGILRRLSCDRYSALIPIITVLYAVALASIIAVTLATKGKGANALSSR